MLIKHTNVFPNKPTVYITFYHIFLNIVDREHLASDETSSSGSTLFLMHMRSPC